MAYQQLVHTCELVPQFRLRLYKVLNLRGELKIGSIKAGILSSYVVSSDRKKYNIFFLLDETPYELKTSALIERVFNSPLEFNTLYSDELKHLTKGYGLVLFCQCASLPELNWL